MKTIRSLLASIAVLAMMFAMFVPAGAEENTEGSINDYLVAYWNFEGEGDEALKNKAPLNGENPLIKNGDVTVADGTAAVPKEAGAYLQASNITDWTSGTQATIYLRLKITGDTTSYANFVFAGGSFRMYARKWTANGNYIIEGKTGHTPRLEDVNVGIDENGKWNNGDWIYAALAVNVDGADNHSRLYLSLDGKTWRMRQTDPVGTPKASIADFLNNPEAVLMFGKANGTDAQTAGFEYDDIRIYDRVLSLDEVKTIPSESASNVRAIGYQRTVKGGETYGLRFVMGLQDISDYETVGMTVKAMTEKGTEATWGGPDKASTTVYQSIIGMENGEEKTFYAIDHQVTYLYCMTVMDIPASEGRITFTVTPFAIDRDGQQINFESVTFVPTEHE